MRPHRGGGDVEAAGDLFVRQALGNQMGCFLLAWAEPDDACRIGGAGG